MFAEMVTELHSQGLTAQSYLRRLYEECVFLLDPISTLVHNNSLDMVISRCVTPHSLSAGLTGDVQTRNSYFICSDAVKIDRIFWGLRNFEETVRLC